MIITIAGAPGSGKSTAGRLLAAKIGYKFISMGDLYKQAATEAGLTVNEFLEQNKNNPAFDKHFDEEQKKLGQDENIVLDSRLGFHLFPQAFKIYIDVDPSAAAHRVYEAHRNNDKYLSYEDAFAHVQLRKAQEVENYGKHYGVQVHDISNFDLVINSSTLTPQEVVEEILKNIIE
jgi:CMP/dCMP kinase